MCEKLFLNLTQISLKNKENTKRGGDKKVQKKEKNYEK